MKKKDAVFALCCIVGAVSFAYAQDTEEVSKFSSDYEQEVKENLNKPSHWEIAAAFRVGGATYEESVGDITSTYHAVFPEVFLSAKNRTENDIEHEIDFSFGQSTTSTENWYVSEAAYQTNKLDFYRLCFKGSIGKIFYSDRVPDLQLIPFIGYGFRFINFTRSDFDIFNPVTIPESVSEKYYLQYGDLGLKFDKKLNEKFGISGAGSYGYVFYNLADNGELGSVKGTDGKYIIDGSVNLHYALSRSVKLDFGGFLEFQDINGGHSGQVVWPDNKLNIYGGLFGARFVF